MTEKRRVVIGMLGTRMDCRPPEIRWERWRPTVSLCRLPDLRVDRLDLLIQEQFAGPARLVMEDIARISPDTEIRPHLFRLDDPWDFEQVYAMLYDFAESYPFDTDAEEYCVHMTTGTHVMQICLFLLAESRHIPARLLQTWPRRGRGGEGEAEVAHMLIDLDLSRYDRIAARFRRQAGADEDFLKDGIGTRSPRFNRLIGQIAQAGAESSDPILLVGPTGSGKTRLARRIFEWRRMRRKVTGDLVELNCATLRGTAAMSALFGHVRGAYTGATEARRGMLRAADGGMLFLDEVGELGPDEQAMLLRALEEKSFRPLGSDREEHADFQLICGTNRDLGAMAERGEFRADLLSRINLWTFELPGLAERPEDIEPNLRHELNRQARLRGRKTEFSRGALDLFLRLATSPEAAWKGSFRDLSGAVARMTALAAGGRITEEGVREEWARLLRSWNPPSAPPAGFAADQALVRDVLSAAGGDPDALDPFDIPQLAHVIRTCRRSATLSEAGRRLFAVSRLARTSRNDADRPRKFLARFGLSWADVRGGGRSG